VLLESQEVPKSMYPLAPPAEVGLIDHLFASTQLLQAGIAP